MELDSAPPPCPQAPSPSRLEMTQVHLLLGVNSKCKARGRGGARLKLGAGSWMSHVLALRPPGIGGGVEDGERTEAATTQAHPVSTQPSSGTSGSVLRTLSPNSSFYCVRGLRPREGPERTSGLSRDTQHITGLGTSELWVRIPEPGTELPGGLPCPESDPTVYPEGALREVCNCNHC